MPSRICKLFLVLLCPASFAVFYHLPQILSVHKEFFLPQNRSLCACDSCIKEPNPWLTELLAASPQPFLSTKNNITEGTFNYWRRFQYDRRNFSYYNQTVEKVFRMFSHIPQLAESSPDRCLRCAVVGNSGNLNGSHYGPLIDFHDLVIRMNRAPTKGYEQDVGSRTTHHVMYPHSCTNLGNSTHLLLFPFKIGDLEWLLDTFTPRDDKPQALEANKDLVMILNPAFMEYVHKSWLRKRGHYPSTGFITLVLSLCVCDEVSVFGFGADRYGFWSHYFERVRLKKTSKTGQHPGRHEYNLMMKLNAEKKITFYRGW